ncbi:MAG: tetratricopeptide repeat protein [Planctomycetota bacterium]|jgi:tetratricopeptide (TPR) repeat protein
MSKLPDFRKLWNFQDPAATEASFREILPQAEASGDLNYLLELKTQIARTYGLRKQFDDAHALLDEVEAALDETTKVARLRYLLERGRSINSGGSPEKSRPFFVEAWDYGKEIEQHGLAVDAAHMMAIVEPTEKQRAWNEKAVHYAEESGDPGAMAWLGALYNNMGWTSHEEGDYEEALNLHRKCWDWHKERETGRGERIAKWSVAKQLRMLGRSDEALPMQEELLAEYAEADPGNDGFVHEEIAEIKHAAGDAEAAKDHFAQAYEMLKDIDWVETERKERMKKLSG